MSKEVLVKRVRLLKDLLDVILVVCVQTSSMRLRNATTLLEKV